MEQLPLELFTEIVLKLDPQSLLELCKSSSTISNICKDQSDKIVALWRKKLQQDFPTAKTPNNIIQQFYFAHAFPKQIYYKSSYSLQGYIAVTPSDTPYTLANKIMVLTKIRVTQYFEFKDQDHKTILTLMYPHGDITPKIHRPLSELVTIENVFSKSYKQHKTWRHIYE